MDQNRSSATTSSDRTFDTERVFDARRELVWRAWSECEHLQHWFGPKDWTLPVCKMDFRVGGSWHYCMLGPNGEESWGKTVYHEIVELERIVSTDAFSDEAGTIAEEMPKMLITVTFAEMDGKTKVTSQTQFGSAAELESLLEMGMVEGLTQTWDRLEAHLANI